MKKNKINTILKDLVQLVKDDMDELKRNDPKEWNRIRLENYKNKYG